MSEEFNKNQESLEEKTNPLNSIEDNSAIQYEDEDFGEVIDLGTQTIKKLPNADKIVDSATNKVIDRKDLTPYDQIKIFAQQHGITLRKPNSGCKKCYGRGYESLNLNGSPNPCNCIFPPKTENEKTNDFMNDLRMMESQSNRKSRRHDWFSKSGRHRKSLLNALRKRYIAETVAKDTSNG